MSASVDVSRWVGEWQKTCVVKESAKNPPNLQPPLDFLRAKHIREEPNLGAHFHANKTVFALQCNGEFYNSVLDSSSHGNPSSFSSFPESA